MSGASKKIGKKIHSHKSLNKSFGDVTLNDFANSAVSNGKGRLKKSATNTAVREVKQLSAESNDKAWYDKLEEYEDFEFVEEYEEDGTRAVVMKRHSRRHKKTVCEDDCDTWSSGMEYPLDIWFLISEYIRPEDVFTFASICKNALHVVNTAKFWFHMYKRHYKTVPNMPERLQPECMMRLYGLRSTVIRALYYMYPPFINKVKAVTTFEGDPHKLVKRQCVLMWHQKCKNQWLFYFKLKQNNLVLGRGTGEISTKPDLIEMLEDVSANEDEGCKVLQVTCLNFTRIPMVWGMSLCSVSLTKGLMLHRLQLMFGAPHVCHMVGKCHEAQLGSSTVVLDSITNVRVLDWWHPMYPHSTNTSFNIHIDEVI